LQETVLVRRWAVVVLGLRDVVTVEGSIVVAAAPVGRALLGCTGGTMQYVRLMIVYIA